MNTTTPSLSYDAIALLGFGAALTDEPLPVALPGEIVIRYGGWSLQELRKSDIGNQLIWQDQHWCNNYPWSHEPLPSGIYRLRIPVPGSNDKNFADQQALLQEGEEPAPLVLVATALLAHHLQTNEDLLKNDWTRCKEEDADGDHVGLYWRGGRLFVSCSWDGRVGGVWLSSVRRVS
jgi:hypothetical protein